MPRSNDDVARVLTEFADLLAIVADDPFKPRAYEKAARAIGGFPDELRDLDDAGIRAIPNVGKSIAEKVRSVLETGTFPELEELRAQVPSGVRAMTAIPGLGAAVARVQPLVQLSAAEHVMPYRNAVEVTVVPFGFTVPGSVALLMPTFDAALANGVGGPRVVNCFSLPHIGPTVLVAQSL